MPHGHEIGEVGELQITDERIMAFVPEAHVDATTSVARAPMRDGMDRRFRLDPVFEKSNHRETGDPGMDQQHHAADEKDRTGREERNADFGKRHNRCRLHPPMTIPPTSKTKNQTTITTMRVEVDRGSTS